MTSERSDSRPSLKSRMGESLGPFSECVDEARVKEFRAVVSDSGIQSVPPTFLTVFRKSEFDLLAALGVPLVKVLHAEQEYTYTRALRVGEKLTYVTTLANVLEKRGSNSSLTFLVVETFFYEEGAGTRGTPLACSKTTIVVRDKLGEKK